MESFFLPFAAAAFVSLLIAIAWAGRKLADNLRRK
jgi:hypothetical protein